MKKRYQTPIALATALALALSGPMSAMAGHDDYGKHGKGHYSGKTWKGHDHHGGKSWKHHGRKGGKYNKYYGHRGGHGHGKHVTKYKYKYDDDDDGEKFLIGLLVGGIAGYAFSQHNDQTYQVYDSYAVRDPVYTSSGYSTGGGSCLQQREYQSRVIVGGRTVDAYGTACLQPDGSWRYGPAELEPY
jgi:hypothetical protein